MPDRYVGSNDTGDRDIVDASQVLSQSIVAASKSIAARAAVGADTKVVRRASGVFCRPVMGAQLIDFGVDVVHNGRTFATAVVTASQAGRTCAVVTVLLDVPTNDVVRHPPQLPTSSPETAIAREMPLTGREVRLGGRRRSQRSG